LKEKPDKANETQLVMLAKVNAEMSNKKKIETNIIISGIPAATNPTESKEHDQEQINSLLKALEPNLSIKNTKRVVRLKKKTIIEMSNLNFCLLNLTLLRTRK